MINRGGLLGGMGDLSGIVYVKGVNVLCDWRNGDYLEVQPAALINVESARAEGSARRPHQRGAGWSRARL